MAVVTLAEAKSQCRVTHNLEDAKIQMYMDAADGWIRNFLNRETVPNKPEIRSAALLIIEHLYNNASAFTDIKMYKNPAIDALLYPYRENIGI